MGHHAPVKPRDRNVSAATLTDTIEQRIAVDPSPNSVSGATTSSREALATRLRRRGITSHSVTAADGQVDLLIQAKNRRNWAPAPGQPPISPQYARARACIMGSQYGVPADTKVEALQRARRRDICAIRMGARARHGIKQNGWPSPIRQALRCPHPQGHALPAAHLPERPLPKPWWPLHRSQDEGRPTPDRGGPAAPLEALAFAKPGEPVMGTPLPGILARYSNREPPRQRPAGACDTFSAKAL
jgi:hypothetical protein